jgi:hypothetical protein
MEDDYEPWIGQHGKEMFVGCYKVLSRHLLGRMEERNKINQWRKRVLRPRLKLNKLKKKD